jgi:hypothetical protein
MLMAVFKPVDGMTCGQAGRNLQGSFDTFVLSNSPRTLTRLLVQWLEKNSIQLSNYFVYLRSNAWHLKIIEVPTSNNDLQSI